ncbi:MAG: leucine-rich repeat domain-containing protein [Microscillaceae bacterium]|nr:leucine-rich repeat domain-containing protein [Microscillaceae bacterium]
MESFEVQQSVSEVVLSGFNKLKRFNIGRGGGLDNIDFISLDGFQSLEMLDLSGKNLKSIELKKCPSLSELILVENQISDVSSLQSLTKLRKLNLHHNQIEDITVLHHLKALESLDLSENQIQEISLDFLNQLPGLNELYLSGNPIKNIPAEYFKGGRFDSSRFDVSHPATPSWKTAPKGLPLKKAKNSQKWTKAKKCFAL